MAHYRFKGVMTPRQERALINKEHTFTDDYVPPKVSGLEALDQDLMYNVNDTGYGRIELTKDQATNTFVPIHVIRPAQSTMSDIVAIVCAYHEHFIKHGNSNMEVLYDDESDANVDSYHRTECEKAIKRMQDMGLKVHLGLDTLITEHTPNRQY